MLDPTRLYRLRDGVYAPDLLIVAVAELDLFSWLATRGDATVEAISHEFELHARPVDVLVTYLTALDLVQRRGAHVAVTDLARQHLVAGSPYDLRPYYASLRERPGCRELLDVLRTGRPAAWASAPDAGWAARLADPAFAETFTAAMDARGRFLGPLLAGALADALSDSAPRRILDIGGSSGIYLTAVLDALPSASGAVFERPPVDVAAQALLRARGTTRADVLSGDMFDGLPTGFDLHLFSHVLHDWDEPRVRALLAASYASLPDGGVFVDHDVHVDADKSGPLSAAEYSVLLMHSTPGKCWSVGELSDLLRDTGFAEPAIRPTGADRSAMIARKG